MINSLDESYIEKKVRSCFAKAENTVEEMIRKIEREINGDHASNCCLPGNYLETNVLTTLCFNGHHTKSKNVTSYEVDESDNKLPWKRHQQKEHF